MQRGPGAAQAKISGGKQADVDGFWRAAVHSVTRTTPRLGLRRRLVPWTLAVVLLVGVGAAGAAFATSTYWLLWTCVGLVLALAVLASATHAWRASTRYKRPLDAPVDQPENRAASSAARPARSGPPRR